MTKAKKHGEYLALGIITVVGLVLGLAFFGVIYAMYLSATWDSTTAWTTAILLVVFILAVWYVITIVLKKKKYEEAYLKAFWLGIGFIIALLIVSGLIGYLGLSVGLSVTALVYAGKQNQYKLPSF